MQRRNQEIGELEKRLEQKELALGNSEAEVTALKSQLEQAIKESRDEKVSIGTSQIEPLLAEEHKPKTLKKMCQTRVTRMGFKPRMKENIDRRENQGRAAFGMEQRV